MDKKDLLCGVLEFDTPAKRKGIIVKDEKELVDIWVIINNISDKKGGDLLKKYEEDVFKESYNTYFIMSYFLNFPECVRIVYNLYLNAFDVDPITHYRFLFNAIPRNSNRRVNWNLFTREKEEYAKLQKKITILRTYYDISKRVAMYYLGLYTDEQILEMESEMNASKGGVERV